MDVYIHPELADGITVRGDDGDEIELDPSAVFYPEPAEAPGQQPTIVICADETTAESFCSPE